MQDSIRHIEQRLGGQNSTGASTNASHPTDQSHNPHPYGDRKMYPPTNPSSVSDPNANSGELHYASANDPSYGKMGHGPATRNAGGNPAKGSYSIPTARKAYVEEVPDHEAGMGSVDRLDTGGPYKESIEDYGYSDPGLEAGHGNPLGISKAAAQGPMTDKSSGAGSNMGTGSHHFGEEHSSAHAGARVGRQPGAEATTVDALRERRERDFEGGVSSMGGRKGSVRGPE
ncbi:hypothetical protein BJ508DRAFT_38638 [Ascobolus immersus RN42]|uniref:Uncharacterized protein n=1 Tax=Ascobolus immersus RN42 TaxID=1160509 RepID=A0A3N4IEB4_ASCIM|nr:hypothetical protein BJ508DRAFT_38638 [Ascobolus immersus RN42]